jgi:mannitol/fructose-specific phosphotransferase system IIA component
MQEGIYFNLSESEYHAAHAISTSGIKTLFISGMEYWENYLNPEREKTTTPAMEFGKAAHKYFLENDKFFDEYAFEPSKSDFDMVLDTQKDMQEYCIANGINFAPSHNKAKLAEAIRQSGSTATIWFEVLEAFEKKNEGKNILDAKDAKKLIKMRDTFLMYDNLKTTFEAGYSEVSIFIKVHDITFKCRIDYMKAGEDIDYKTFSNSKGKKLEKCIFEAIQYEMYNVQYFLYSQIMKEVANRLQKNTLPIHGNVTPDFIESLKNPEARQFSLLFQGSAAPHECLKVNLVKAMHEGATTNEYHNSARHIYSEGFNLYKSKIDAELDIYDKKTWISSCQELTLMDENVPNIIYQAY